MRKYLGVLAVLAALCVMSWAQATTPAPAPATQEPAPTPSAPVQATPEATTIPSAPVNAKPPIQYPRFEVFAGGTYAEAGFFNAGHWAGLPGWGRLIRYQCDALVGIPVRGRPILRNLPNSWSSSGALSVESGRFL